MSRRLAVLLMFCAALPWAGARAQSNTAETTFRVTARVNAVCEVTAGNLDFGAYTSQANNPLRSTTKLQATCTPDTTYQIGLNEGISGASVNERKMVAGTGTLNYQLYSDSSRTTIWGNTTGSDTVTGVGTGLRQDHTVYGAVPAAQSVPAGSYEDTITVRIFY